MCYGSQIYGTLFAFDTSVYTYSSSRLDRWRVLRPLALDIAPRSVLSESVVLQACEWKINTASIITVRSKIWIRKGACVGQSRATPSGLNGAVTCPLGQRE